jgi:hypothetical protein
LRPLRIQAIDAASVLSVLQRIADQTVMPIRATGGDAR